MNKRIDAKSEKRSVVSERGKKDLRLDQTKELILVLQNLSDQERALRRQYELHIINYADMASELEFMNHKKTNIKKQLVGKAHVTKSGKLRSIKKHAPTASYRTGYYYTSLEGGQIVKGKTLDILYDRLFDIYYQSDCSHNVESIFRLALKEKAETENPNLKTIKRYETDYRRFITDELAMSDIRMITEIDLKRYSQELVHRMAISDKAFLNYKGVLNLIFRYAIIHGLVEKNPVALINNRVYQKSCDCHRPTAEEKMFSQEEIESLLAEVDRRKGLKRNGEYYSFGYALKFAALTGVRVGELCGLQWEDIDLDALAIHIHRQQLIEYEEGHLQYHLADHTKNEKGISQDGRWFPITDELLELLQETARAQQAAGIESEYLFCRSNGKPMTIHAYTRFLRRICEKLKIRVTCNHGFRMALNSNVLIPNGIPETDRARLLGHSVRTNLSYYSYESRNYLGSTRDKLNASKKQKGSISVKKEVLQVIPFTKRESPQTLSL